ncbi:NADH dehydrogenase [ubiquinone] 1 alpha subcomplex subunit 12 [Mantella aurantiaca]
MAEYIAVLRRGIGQIRARGLLGSFWQVLRSGELKTGALVGVDKYGNKYYEDKRNFFARHRWVEYTSMMNGKYTYWNLDGSMVPPEWHRWLHCMTEDPPTTHPPADHKYIWKTHQFNVSATPEQYVPYSTTRKKIEEWVPPPSSKL